MTVTPVTERLTVPAIGGPRHGGALLMVLVAAAPLLAQIAHELPGLAWDAPLASDYAGIENDVRTALSGDLLLGPSTRLGVRNLGPVDAYWTVPFYAATGEGAGGMVLAAWAANVVGIAAAVLVVRAAAGATAAWAAALTLAAALTRAGPAALSEFYNPAMTVAPVIVATLACAALATGRWTMLPVALAAASIGTQCHLVAAPGLGVMLVVAVISALRAGRPTRRDLALTSVLALALWTPTLIDQVAGTANLSGVVAAMARGPGSADQPFGDPGPSLPRPERPAVALELATLTRPDAALTGTLLVTARGLPAGSASRTAAGGIVVVGVLAAARWQRRRSRFGSTVIVLGALGAVTTYAATASVARGFFTYYYAPLPAYGVAMAVGLAILAAARLRRTGATTPVVGVLAVTLAVGGYATTSNVVSIVIDGGANPVDQLRFVDQLEQRVPPRCADLGVALHASAHQTADVWTLIVLMDKRGIPTTVPPNLEPFVGPGHERTGREAISVRVPTLQQFRARQPIELIGAARCPAPAGPG